MNEIIRQRIDALIPLLKDPDPEVRTMVAHAIEHLEASSDIKETLQTLKAGNMGERIAAIHALGEIGGQAVVAPLVYCAGRPEDDIRSAAVEILGRLADPSTLSILLERELIVSRAPFRFAHAARHDFAAAVPLPTLLASYHPSQQNTQTGRLTPAMFLTVFESASKILAAK